MKTKFFYRGLFDKMQKKMVQTHNYHYTTQNFLQRMKNTIITKKIILSDFYDIMFRRFTQDILPLLTQENKQKNSWTIQKWSNFRANDTKCWMFGISKFREHRLELFRMLYTLGYFNYIQYCVLFLHLNRVFLKWKDD